MRFAGALVASHACHWLDACVRVRLCRRRATGGTCTGCGAPWVRPGVGARAARHARAVSGRHATSRSSWRRVARCHAWPLHCWHRPHGRRCAFTTCTVAAVLSPRARSPLCFHRPHGRRCAFTARMATTARINRHARRLLVAVAAVPAPRQPRKPPLCHAVRRQQSWNGHARLLSMCGHCSLCATCCAQASTSGLCWEAASHPLGWIALRGW
jgi:hypothetical protein